MLVLMHTGTRADNCEVPAVTVVEHGRSLKAMRLMNLFLFLLQAVLFDVSAILTIECHATFTLDMTEQHVIQHSPGSSYRIDVSPGACTPGPHGCLRIAYQRHRPQHLGSIKARLLHGH